VGAAARDQKGFRKLPDRTANICQDLDGILWKRSKDSPFISMSENEIQKIGMDRSP
jgi:hypothetical protein